LITKIETLPDLPIELAQSQEEKWKAFNKALGVTANCIKLYFAFYQVPKITFVYFLDVFITIM